MGDPDRIHSGSEQPLVNSAGPRPWGGAVVRVTTAGGVTLVDVEGELDAPAVRRWTELLNSALTEGAMGVTVDLRGCRALDVGCLSLLATASGKLKERGDRGINLVTTPGSPLERTVRATAAKRLPRYS